MGSAQDFHFDAVSQVRMPAWNSGLVSLVGDACQSVSLSSEQAGTTHAL